MKFIFLEKFSKTLDKTKKDVKIFNILNFKFFNQYNSKLIFSKIKINFKTKSE